MGNPWEPRARDQQLLGPCSEAEAVRGFPVQEEEVAAEGMAQEVSEEGAFRNGGVGHWLTGSGFEIFLSSRKLPTSN